MAFLADGFLDGRGIAHRRTPFAARQMASDFSLNISSCSGVNPRNAASANVGSTPGREPRCSTGLWHQQSHVVLLQHPTSWNPLSGQ
jgi:hypothetical protein